MDIIYYVSVILLLLVILCLPLILIVLLIKPHILNDRSFIKKPFSRGKMIAVTFLIFFGSFVGFGGAIAATEPEYIKQERTAREAAEEKAAKDAEAKKQKEAQEAQRRKAEAQKPIVKQEIKREPLPFQSIEEQDGTIAKDERRVAVEGVNGEVTSTFDVTYKGGKEVSRVQVKSEITKPSVTKVTKIGTYVAPVVKPPVITPPPATSAYYKNCTAARAAGAAPVYAGQPGYGRHLDKDGDGIGCE